MSLRYTRRWYEFYAGAWSKSLEVGLEEESQKWPLLLTVDSIMLQPAVLTL